MALSPSAGSAPAAGEAVCRVCRLRQPNPTRRRLAPIDGVEYCITRCSGCGAIWAQS